MDHARSEHGDLRPQIELLSDRRSAALPDDCRECTCSECRLMFLAQDELKVRVHARGAHCEGGHDKQQQRLTGQIFFRCRVCRMYFRFVYVVHDIV